MCTCVGNKVSVRRAQEFVKPHLTSTTCIQLAPQIPQQTTGMGTGRGGANIVTKRGERQSTPPPQDPQTNYKR